MFLWLFILEQLKVHTSHTKDISIITISSVCQPGWTYNSKTFKCYKFVEKAGDWADAHNNCHALAAIAAKNIGPVPPVRVGLVSIRDAEENIFVGRDIAKGRYILTGGNRLVDGTWIWTDGSMWDFTNWTPGNPNNWKGENGQIRENSVKLNYLRVGGWNDGFYRNTNTYVCQYLDVNQFTK